MLFHGEKYIVKVAFKQHLSVKAFSARRLIEGCVYNNNYHALKKLFLLFFRIRVLNTICN